MILYYSVCCLLMLCIPGLATAASINPQVNQTKQCKSIEILVVHKGCLTQEEYKIYIKLLDTKDTGANDTGAAPERTNVKVTRPPIQFKSLDTTPQPHKSKEFGFKVEYPEVIQSDKTDKSNARSHHSGSYHNYLNNLDSKKRFANDEEVNGEHTVGHNRPHSYAFLPGRRLESFRRCRPYEVLARNNRCIRKAGPTGLYEHKDHVYGIQQRKRKEAYKTNN